jgi:hypothetical protein
MQVESTLFRLSKGMLVSGSSVFRDMFAVAQADILEGTNDETAIIIPGVSASEFETFLALLLW